MLGLIARVTSAPSFNLALVLLWFGVMFARATILARRLAALHALKAGAPELDETIVRRLRRWRHGSHTARQVALRVSAAVDVPVAVGFGRPAILLPLHVARDASAADLDQIVLHEHAHLNRYDDWTNLAERAISCALWFNPVISFLLRRISLEREIACDDRVIAQTGRAHRYAACLWKLVGTSRLPATAILAPGALFTSKQITTRIERLLDSHRNALPRLSPSSIAIIAVLGIGAVILQAQRAPAIAVTGLQPFHPAPRRPTASPPSRLAWHPPASPHRADIDRTVNDALRRANIDRTVGDALRRANVGRTVNDALRRANVNRTVNDASHRADIEPTVSDALRRADVKRTVNDALRRADVNHTVKDALRRANVERTVNDALRRAKVERTVRDALERADAGPATAALTGEIDQAIKGVPAQANVAARTAATAADAHVGRSGRADEALLNTAGAAAAESANGTDQTALVRNLPNFRRIVFETGIRVEVRRSTRSRIDFGDAVEEARHTTTEVDGDTLTIGGSGSWTDQDPSALITIETPSLDGIEVDGSSSVVVDDVRAERLTLTMNGSGAIVVASGFTPSASVENAGSGTIDLVRLRTSTLSVSVEGSGNVKLTAPRALTLAIDGSGDIEVHGHAQALSSQINGSGRIVGE